MDVTGKVAVITGGTGVLFSVVARALARAGARVAILARYADKPEALAEVMCKECGEVVGYGCDVLDKPCLEEIAADIVDGWGRIDILINGAGGNRAEATAMPGERTFFDLPPEAMQWVFNLNFFGTVLASQAFAAPMAQQGEGVILNVSSMASIVPLTRVVAYSAAKAAVNNFTQWLAVYMAQAYSPAIRVNAIAPGFFLTEQNRYLLVDEASGAMTARGQQIIDHTPMARYGEPEDLVGAVMWLVSPASRFVTGTVIPVDGGFSAYSGV